MGPKDHILSISSFLAEPLPMFSCGNSRNLVNKTWKLNCYLKRPEVLVCGLSRSFSTHWVAAGILSLENEALTLLMNDVGDKAL